MKPKKKSLAAALQANKGNYAAALESIGLGVVLDKKKQVIRITDAMLNGQLDDAEFALLANIPTLTGIWLRDVRISNRGLAALEKMPQLTSLMLEAKRLTDGCLKHLRHVPLLNQLHLNGTKVTGRGFAQLPHPERLTSLDFHDSPIDDEGLKAIARCDQMTSLGLWGTAITDAGLTHLQNCHQLTDLSLYETVITNGGVKKLAKLPALTSLELSETDTNDKCLAELLKLPKLKDVSFGEDQISVATLEKLQAAGIEVGHGNLLNVVRKENLLRYVGMDFEVDTKKSSLVAMIDPEGQGIYWKLDIHCTEKYVPDHMSPAHLEGPPIQSRRCWDDLVGETLRINFDPDALHPILPDNPSNIYVGWHAAPNDHRIKFVKRRGNSFLIDWSCDAGESKNEHTPVWVFAEIPFTELIVIGGKPLTAAEAKLRAAAHFNLKDFGPPKLHNIEHFPHARFRFVGA